MDWMRIQFRTYGAKRIQVRGVYGQSTTGWYDILSSASTFSYTLPAINSHTDVSITQPWTMPTPHIIQIQDNSSAVPLLCTNWWVANNVLTVKVYNIHSSNAGSHNVVFQCIF